MTLVSNRSPAALHYQGKAKGPGGRGIRPRALCFPRPCTKKAPDTFSLYPVPNFKIFFTSYLIAPSTIPCIICFCANRNKIMIGIIASSAADKIKSHCFT